MPVKFLDEQPAQSQKGTQKSRIRFLDEEPRGSALTGFIAGAGDVASLGLGRPAAAFLRTLNEDDSVFDNRSFGQKFRENLANVSKDVRQSKEDSPIASGIGTVAGFVSPGSLARKGFEKVTGAVASRLPQNLLGRGVAAGVGNVAVEQALSERGLGDISGRAKDLPLQFGVGTAGGLSGELIGRGAEKILGRSKNIVPEVKEAVKNAKSSGFDVTLSPAEQTTTRATDFTESLIERSPFSSNQFANLGRLQLKQLEKAASGLEAKAGLQSSELVDEAYIGKAIFDRLEDLRGQFSKASNKLYSQVDTLANNSPFPPKNALNALERAEREVSKGIKLQRGPVGQTLKDLRNKWASGTETFEGLRTKISEIGGEVSALKRTGNANEARILSQLQDGLIKDMESLAGFYEKSGNGAAAQALKKANQFYREGKKTLENEIIKDVDKLVTPSSLRVPGVVEKDSYEKLFEKIVKSGRSQKIQELRNFIGEDSFEPIRQRFLQNIVRDPANGDFNLLGNALENRIKKIGGDRMLQTILGPEDAKALKALSQVAKFAKTASKTEKTPAGFNISTLSAAAAPAAIAGGAFGLGASPLEALALGGIGSAGLAKIWYSPLGRKLLVEGFDAFNGNITKDRARLLLVGIANQIGKKTQE